LWTRHAIQSSKDGAEDVFLARITPGTPAPDTTAPTTTINLFGTIGSNGWWRSAINVTLRAVDDENGTGVAFVEYSLNGGAWQRYTGTFLVASQRTTVVRARATDRAGNAENPGASSTFMIDWIPPAIAINSPAAIEYVRTDSLLVSFGATDSLSGLGSATGTIDGTTVTNGQTIPLLTLALGFHTLFVSAADQAGNTSLTTVTFRIVATIDTLIGAVNTFIAAGQIDASGGRSLLSNLQDAKQLLSRGNLAAARSKLTDFKSQVSGKSGRSISPSAAQLLIADADYVLGAL
jgi:cytochrome c